MLNKAVLFIVSFAVWLLLTGSLRGQDVLVGAGVCLMIAFLLGDIFAGDLRKFISPSRLFWWLYFLLIFSYYCLKANLDMAYRIIHPQLSIKPGIVKIKTGLKSPLGRAFLANSITLTPGTLSVDIKGEDLYIHWIYVKTDDVEKATRIISAKFEPILAKVFE